MRKSILFISSFSLLLFSCAVSIDDVFDDSASERIEEAMKECARLLLTSDNGWIVEYFPQKNQAYGGYNLYFKFLDSENVIIQGEQAGTEAAESKYSIKGDMGPTLNFDTYNPILHYYSDPSMNIGGGFALGFEGDYEFVFEKGTSEKLEFRGKKTKNRIIMTPLPEGTQWNDVFASIDHVDDFIAAPEFVAEIDDQQVVFSNPNGRTFEIVDKGAVVRLPFIVQGDELNLYNPVDALGMTFTGFECNYDTGKLIARTSKGEFAMTAVYPGDYLLVNDYPGDYSLSVSSAVGTPPVTKPVTLTKLSSTTIAISGITFWDIIAQYNRKTGKLELRSQTLDRVHGNYLRLAPWNGNNLWATHIYLGQVTEWNRDYNNFVLTWVDAGEMSSPIVGFVIWQTSGINSGALGDYTSIDLEYRRFANMVMTKL